MKKNFLKSFILSTTVLTCVGFNASAVERPEFQVFNFEDGSIVQNISNNGKWAVANGINPANTLWTFFPKLIDLSKTSDNVIELLTKEELGGSVNSASANDITDDGKLIVGNYANAPAIYHVDTQKWEMLPTPNAPYDSPWVDGIVSAVTPDGKWAVGKMSAKAYFYEEPVLWSLEGTPTIVETNWPMEDLSGNWQEQTRFTGISADGKTIIGCVSYSYPDDVMYFIYDVDSKEWFPIGFDIKDGKYEPKFEGIHHANDVVLSPNGKYATGSLYMVKFEDGSNNASQYTVPYLYDIENDKFEIYDGIEDVGMSGGAVGDDGVIYASTPDGNPVRNWHARVDNYWYSFNSIVKQIYDIEFVGATGYDNTGTMWAMSSDGLKFCSFTYPIGESYIVEMPKTLSELAPQIDLLKNYSVTPQEGAIMSSISSVSISFDRYVEVIGDKSSVQIQDSEGNVLKNSVTFKAESEESKTLNIGFRSPVLEDNKTYYVVIPSGSFQILGDETKKNNEIRILYKGRSSKPVALKSINPSDGSSVALLNNSSNPILMTFDANLALGESSATNAPGHLYVIDKDNSEELVADLYIAVSGQQALLYPISEQRLFEGSNYKVVVDAGAVTDLSGSNGNEQFSVTYVGTYVREINPGASTLFSEDFSKGLANMMLYEGDHNTPTEEMISIDFSDADNYPWSLATDDSSDLAASTHSVYTNGGQSDDWMVIPQLYIDDELTVLSFDAQSYKAKNDVLKVLIWENDDVINNLTSTVIENFRNNATIEFSEVLTPGKTEENLFGEWTHYAVDLAKYAGKNIYIAFYNDNTNQSVMFVDNVIVKRNMDFIVSLETNSTVVSQKDAKIQGRLKVENETETYKNFVATLNDTEGNQVDQLSANVELKYGDIYSFEFTKTLPLEIGKTNSYTVDIKLDEAEISTAGEIKNLYFKPTKRVVLEKCTGQGCGNCPLGIVMTEKLQETYGDLFIPIAIHAYTGDSFGIGIVPNYAQALGLSAAPTGIVNRNGHIASPMMSQMNGDKKEYIYTSTAEPLWWDDVATEFNTLADADIQIRDAQYNTTTKTIKIPVEYKYAVDATGMNVNLFGVVMENNLRGSQSNYFSAETDPLLGEWGEGGIYGESVVRKYYYNHVVRGAYGITFNGTGGHIESDVVAGETYTTEINMTIPETIKEIANCEAVVMMIDANTGKVINAASAKIYDEAGIDNVNVEDIDVRISSSAIEVNANGAIEVTIYSAEGYVLSSVKGCDVVNIPSIDYNGLGIVKVVAGDAVVVKKVVL